MPSFWRRPFLLLETNSKVISLFYYPKTVKLRILSFRSVTTGEAFSSHDAPVVSVKYCKCFQQVLSVCEGSVSIFKELVLRM